MQLFKENIIGPGMATLIRQFDLAGISNEEMKIMKIVQSLKEFS